MSEPGNPEAPSDAPARRPLAGAGRTGAVKNPWPFMGLIVVLCVAGWFIVNWMQSTTSIQDCVMSGRKNCAPLDPQSGR